MTNWRKLSKEEQILRVQMALKKNVNFSNDTTLGYPASKLDGKVFYSDAPFLKDAPVLTTFVSNPNHIGCHTTGDSESAFEGTHALEREALDLIAIEIFKAEPGKYDGYIASGGTEANIQAMWMYRNYFQKTHNAKVEEIALLASEDTHYSIAKGANLLMLDLIKVPVEKYSRAIEISNLDKLIALAVNQGKKYIIVFCNMGTTMFGSVDDPQVYVDVLERYTLSFKMHVDAAYGGFIYPFLTPDNKLDFRNPYIHSITVDAHKMLQAPYGTGIFLCRKGWIENVLTPEASYVQGMDITLCGSRSGANAVAVWMILTTYGANGWFEKIKVLQMRTDWFCHQLDLLLVTYFREPYMNIVTLKASHIPKSLAKKFHLVPEKHETENDWYKIVIMEHVEVEHLNSFLTELKAVRSITA